MMKEVSYNGTVYSNSTSGFVGTAYYDSNNGFLQIPEEIYTVFVEVLLSIGFVDTYYWSGNVP
jgi:hypothetical protein